MRFDILTLFPEFFRPLLEKGTLRQAIKKGLLDVRLVDIRSFAKGLHKVTDDRPYGGGNGMIMKPGPIYRALNSVERVTGRSSVILLTPQGKKFDQTMAWQLAEWDQLILVCGRYEGIDERIRAHYIDMEISIGDYILSGGEPGAIVVLDTVCRLIPGVLGGERSNLEDSFQDGLLEYPHYTRPRVFMGEEVPSILLSGDHEKIRAWRKAEAIKRTHQRRPDLLEKAGLAEKDHADRD
jgi:tRNA (guanine37-N1)-methyltransferase